MVAVVQEDEVFSTEEQREMFPNSLSPYGSNFRKHVKKETTCRQLLYLPVSSWIKQTTSVNGTYFFPTKNIQKAVYSLCDCQTATVVDHHLHTHCLNITQTQKYSQDKKVLQKLHNFL